MHEAVDGFKNLMVEAKYMGMEPAKSCLQIFTLWETNIAIENGDLQWIYPLKMVIFHGYVSLPEGTYIYPIFYDYQLQ